MKAVVYERYGSPDVLELKEVEKPSPGDHEVLIRIHAASVNAYDWHMLRADPFFIRLMAGLTRPKHTILGADVAGRVEAVGKGVTKFKSGDGVFGDISGRGGGGFAEYVCAREDVLTSKPSGVSFEEAAAVPMASVTALQGLRDHGNIRSGQRVLINGASGGVGTYAVQIAKSFGAEVTAVCSTRNLDVARSIGADEVIDYTQEDFTRNGQRYDLILGANGYHAILDYKRALNSGGVFVSSGGAMTQFYQVALLGPLVSMSGGKKLTTYVARPNQGDLEFLRKLLETGEIKPVIDRKYPLSEASEAIRYMEEEHTRGKIVITV